MRHRTVEGAEVRFPIDTARLTRTAEAGDDENRPAVREARFDLEISPEDDFRPPAPVLPVAEGQFEQGTGGHFEPVRWPAAQVLQHGSGEVPTRPTAPTGCVRGAITATHSGQIRKRNSPAGDPAGLSVESLWNATRKIHGPPSARTSSNGEGGIRTPGTVSSTQHFQCCTIGRSVTSP